MVLDFPAAAQDIIDSKISSFDSDGIVLWSRPMDSPSNRANRDQRRVMYGHTPAGTGALEIAVLVRRLRHTIKQVPHVAVGHTSMLEDPAALVADFTTPEAVVADPTFYDQIVLLTPRRGALITSKEKSVWERLLTSQAELGQDDRILKLSWRRSTRGGRLWIRPRVVPSAQAAGLRGDWQGLAGPTQNRIHVQIQGEIGINPDPWLHHIIERITTATASSWTSAPLGSEPQPGQVVPVARPDGAWDGGLLIVAPTPEATRSIATLLNSCCISGAAGTRRLGVRISHDYANTEHGGRATGNGARGARGAGRPPRRT